MKKEHISDALNMLNDDIIEETNNVRTNAKPKRKWVKWGVVAACLCLLWLWSKGRCDRPCGKAVQYEQL